MLYRMVPERDKTSLGIRLFLTEDRLEMMAKERRQSSPVRMVRVEIKARLVHRRGEIVKRHLLVRQ